MRGILSLIFAEMHRHIDREGVFGKNGRPEGHVQLLSMIYSSHSV